MVQYTTTILQFKEQGEKTGWTYIKVPEEIVQKLKPGNKKSFRVKGKLDNHSIQAIALLPMGGGDFIMALNAEIRKDIGKAKGDKLKVQLEPDNKPIELSPEFMECLEDEPAAHQYFKTLPKSFQNYFSKWIVAAKTDTTKTKRIAMAVSALAKQMNFPEMIRTHKKDQDKLSGI